MSGDRTARRQVLRRQVLLGAWLLAVGGLLGRAVQVQVFESSEWRELASDQQRLATEIPAPRGTIYDRNGVPLAVSRERYRVEIDSDLLPQRDSVREALVEALGLTAREARALTDSTRDWAVVPGRYEPSVRPALEGFRGVYLYRDLQRDYPYRMLSAGVLGHVIDEVGAGGIEQAFDEVLAGRAGRSVVARDVRRRTIPGQVFEIRPPEAGGDVHLTLDLGLQENGHQALEDAIETTGARGGDLVVIDPHTGEILAMVSIHDGSSNNLSTINSPYEPGSTLKPFTVAALLETGKARLTDTVEVGDGVWRINGRTLNDVGGHDSTTISLAGALRESSNVGIARAALPLSHGEQYQNLRDFGFGLPTGLELPGEEGGTLWHPSTWEPMSAQSLAVGYEISVTPLQLAMAYGALANGGRLMEARLVSATRSRTGDERRFEPQTVRRVVDEAVTRQITEVLTDAVRDGTGTRASLASFDVAGKTGTTRVYSPKLRNYEPGRYFASFVGYFPAEAPQIVMLVKLDSPAGGTYYGGTTAAPVIRATMEAALAARRSPLDRGDLLDLSGKDGVASAGPPNSPARFAAATSLDDPLAMLADRVVPAPPAPPGRAGPTEFTVPDVSGLPLRAAVRQLHRLGFRVLMDEGGDLLVTGPSAGNRATVGDTIRIRIGPSRTGGTGR